MTETTPAPLVDEPSDDLIEFSNKVAEHVPEAFDGDGTQKGIILDWLALVAERMETADPAGYEWLFRGGRDPRHDHDR